ncbi:MAG: ATP synthase F1 subunit delta [Phycisphaeraceae bacterium]|nr:ATP synthase F1 subunit delta [Phycisphaeraceae bacterium]
MPLTETHADAVSQIYALSLYELARADGGQQAVEAALAELEELADLARSDRMFGEFLSSHVVTTADRRRSLEKILRGRVSDRTLHFLLVLNDKGRLGSILGIVEAFDRIVQKAFGRVEVDAWTAAPMEPADQSSLQRSLSERLGAQVVLHAYTDPAMIGGIRLQIGDQLLDGSLQTQLRNIRQQLTEQGPAKVRAAAERMFGPDPSSNGH